MNRMSSLLYRLQNGQSARVLKVKAVSLQIIINGQSVKTLAKMGEPLSAAMAAAIKSSGNHSRSLPDWQCRDASGVLLESQRKIADFKFLDGARLFVNLGVGAGG